jgi:putative ABC transport system permease protein
MLQAFRFGLLWMVRRPVVAVTSALCLSFGLAACGVAWTLIDRVMLRPFGLPRAGELVVVWEADPTKRQDHIEVSLLNFLDWQHEAQTVASMAAFGSSHWPALARFGSETVPLATRAVTVDFFQTLGVAPALGRAFGPADLEPDAPPAIVISHGLWQSRFAGAASVVGQSLVVDGTEHRIIGVMPRGFVFPDNPHAWLSAEHALGKIFGALPQDAQRFVGILDVVGRRKPDVSNEIVRSELTAIVGSVRRRHGKDDGSVIAAVTPFSEVVLGRLGARLWIAGGMAVAVLLLACANVAAVRWANARERETELWVRLSLGARRARLATSLASESVPLVLLATLGAVVGWSWLVVQLSGAPAVAESGVALFDHRRSAVVVIAALAACTWILIAALPAVLGVWLAARHERADARAMQRTSRVGAPLLLTQAATTIAVVALAVVTLQTFDRLARADVGFAATSDVTLVDITIPRWKYKTLDSMRQLFERLRLALEELPGVTGAAAVSVRPFRYGDIADGQPVRRAGDAAIEPESAPGAHRVIVTPSYFDVLGLQLVEGRAFTDADRADTEPVVIVSQTLARALFGDERALGRQLETFTLSEQWRARTIVGVTADARYRGLELASMEVYVPLTQGPPAIGGFVVRSRDVAIADGPVRAALQEVEPEIALNGVQTTSRLLHVVLSPARLLTTLVAMLGGVGLTLLGLGIFAAAAAAVESARPEIAVRQAVGAMPLQAARAPLRTLTHALIAGILVGLLLSPGLLSAAELLGLEATDSVAPPLVGAVCSVLLAAALAVVPALWKAAKTPPADLLRQN